MLVDQDHGNILALGEGFESCFNRRLLCFCEGCRREHLEQAREGAGERAREALWVRTAVDHQEVVRLKPDSLV